MYSTRDMRERIQRKKEKQKASQLDQLTPVQTQLGNAQIHRRKKIVKTHATVTQWKMQEGCGSIYERCTLFLEAIIGSIAFNLAKIGSKSGDGFVKLNEGSLDPLVGFFLGPRQFNVVFGLNLGSISFLGADFILFNAHSGHINVVFFNLSNGIAIAVGARRRGRRGGRR